MILFLSRTPLAAAADRPAQNPLLEVAIGFVPILIFLGLLVLILRWYLKRHFNSPIVSSTLRERERHIEHMQKMEALTERIAKALEENRKV